MRKLYLVLLIILFANFGCSPTFEPDTRILVKGSVADANNQSIPNLEVGVYTRASNSSGFLFGFGGGQDTYELGKGLTDQEGRFKITSLYDTDEDFAILINGNEILSNYTYYTDTDIFTPSDLTFDIGEIVLRSKTTFTYNIDLSGNDNTIEFRFEYVYPECREVYEQGVLNTELSSCYQVMVEQGYVDESRPNKSRDLQVVLGTIITFTYSVNGADEVTEQVLIDQENYVFNFSY